MSEEIDFNTLPLEEQISNKVWKARVIGYENLTKLISQHKNDNAELIDIYKNYKLDSFINDSNMVALEKGLQAINAFLGFYNGDGNDITSDILPSLINKGICSSTRKLTKETSGLIVTELIRLNKNIDTCVDITLINYDLLHMKKNDKIINGISTILLAIFHNFQSPPCSNETTEHLLAILVALSLHSNIKIRKDAFSCLAIVETLLVDKDLIEELVFSKWKPIQLKEFLKYRESWNNEKNEVLKIEMTKTSQNQSAGDDVYMLTEDRPKEAVATEPKVDTWASKRSTKILNEEMLDEKQFIEDLMAADWKIRVERLNTTLKMMSNVRKLDYVLENYSSIFNALALRMSKDANLQVVQLSIELAIKMFRLIREGYYLVKYTSIILYPMLTRLKEKKVSQLIKDTVMEIVEFHPQKLSCCLDLLLTKFLNHKLLQERCESLDLLNQLLMKYYNSIGVLLPLQKIDEMLPLILKICSEPQPNVRQKGFENLAILMKFVDDGEDEIMPILESKLDSLKVKKIVQLKNEIEVGTVSGGKKRPATSPLKFDNRSKVDGVKLQKPSPKTDQIKTNEPLNIGISLEKDVILPFSNVEERNETAFLEKQELKNENENLKFQLSKANNEILLLTKEMEKITAEFKVLENSKTDCKKEVKQLKQENKDLQGLLKDSKERNISGMSSYATTISYPKTRQGLTAESVLYLSDDKRVDSLRLSSINSVLSNESIDEFYSKNIKQNDDLKEKVSRIREKIRNISINSNSNNIKK